MQLAQQEQSGLGTGLKPRHITMISIAGVIGAGLFVGSNPPSPKRDRGSCSPTPPPVCWWSW